MTVPYERRMNPQTVAAYSRGILLFKLIKAPPMQFVAAAVPV